VYDPAADDQPLPEQPASGSAPPSDQSIPQDSTESAARAPRIPLTERLFALLEVVFCSGFPTQVLIIILLSSQGMRMTTAAGGLSPSFVFILSVVDAVLVIGLVIFFLRARGERVRDVLLGRHKPWGEALLGIAFVPCVFVLLVLVFLTLRTFAPRLHDVARNPFEAMLQTPRDTMIFSFVVVLAGGVREEVQRGFIVHRFSQYLGGGAIGVTVYSIAFGLGHLQQGTDAAIATGVLGAAWGTLYLFRRSIVAPMVSHAAFNLVELLNFMARR
jgi:membrane protease YdiL (CAAX protease family)